MSGDGKKISIVDPAYADRRFQILGGFRQSKQFTDIVLRIGDEELPAHKVILSAASPFFNLMFDDSFIESKQDKVQLLHETNVEVMTAILNYMYSGSVTVHIREIGLLLRNFDYLQMCEMKEECEKTLMKIVNPENCVELTLIADDVRLTELFEKASKCLIRYFYRLYNSNEIKQLSLNQFEAILNLVHCYHPNDTTFKSISSWVEHDKQNRSTHADNLLAKFVSDFLNQATDCPVPINTMKDEFSDSD